MSIDDDHDREEQERTYLLQTAAAVDALRWIGQMETKGFAVGSMDEAGNVLIRFNKGFPSAMIGIIDRGSAPIIAFPETVGTEWVEALPWAFVVTSETEGWLALTAGMAGIRMPDITLIWHAASLIARKIGKAEKVMVGRYRLGVGEPKITGNPVLIGS